MYVYDHAFFGTLSSAIWREDFAWGLGGVACCGGGGGRTIYNITLHCTATLEFMVGKKLDDLDPLMTDRPPDPRVQAHKCV